MAQNIILKAFLDIKDVESKLESINKKTSSLAVGQKYVGSPAIVKQLDQLKELKMMQRQLESGLKVGKTISPFGDPTVIKAAGNGVKELSERQSILRNRIRETSEAYKIMQQNALSPRTKAFRNVYESEGIQGLKNRYALGVKGFTGPRIEKSILQLNDIEPSIKKIRDLEHGMSSLSIKSMELGKTLKGAYSPLVNLLNNLGVQGNSLISIFGTLAGKVTTWLIATTGVFMVIGAVRTLATETKALQDAQINLSKVLDGDRKTKDANIKTTIKFANEMNRLAGTSYTDTINAVKIATQAGFSFSESLNIAKSALIGTNIAEMDMEKSTRYLVATIRQFNLEATDSMWILNQWNELSNKTGAETSELAEAIIRSGQAFKLVGGNLSQLGAIASALIEKTGEGGEKIGTMLRTFSAKYADLEARKSISNSLKASNIRINIYDKETKSFESAFSTLYKLSSVWGTLDDAQKASIATAAVGIRQYSRFVSMVEDFDRTIDGLIYTLNSQGSALKENAERVNTLDFAMRRFKGAVSEIATGKGAIIFLKITAFLFRQISDIIPSLINNVTLLGAAIAVSIQIISGLKLASLLSGLSGVTIATNILTNSWVVFSNVLKAHPILAIVTAITMLNVAVRKYQKSVESARKSTIENFRGDIQNTGNVIDSSEVLLNEVRKGGLNSERGKQISQIYDRHGVSLANVLNSTKAVSDETLRWAKINEQVINQLNFENSSRKQIDTITDSLKKVIDYLDIFKVTFFNVFIGISNTIKNSIISIFNFTTKTLQESLLMQIINKILPNKYEVKIIPIISDDPSYYQYKSKIYDEIKKGLDIEFGLNDKTGKYLNNKGLNNLKKEINEIKDLGNYNEVRKVLSSYRNLTPLDYLKDDKASKYNLINYAKQLMEVLNAVKVEEEKTKKTTGIFEPDETQAKKITRLKELLKEYYNAVYEVDKAVYDKVYAYNKSIVDAVSKDMSSLQGIFSNVGDTLIDNFKTTGLESLTKAITGKQPENPADRIESAFMMGGKGAEGALLEGFLTGTNYLDAALSLWSDKLSMILYKKDADSVIDETVKMLKKDDSMIKNTKALSDLRNILTGRIGTLDEQIKDRVYKEGGLVDRAGVQLENIFNDFKFKDFKIKGLNLETIFTGGSLGASTAKSNGRDSISGTILGAIGAQIGSVGGPLGSVIGGLIGGLLAGGGNGTEEEVKEEQVKYARDSVKELRMVNRNLTTLIETQPNYQLINESYYFAVNNSRGLA